MREFGIESLSSSQVSRAAKLLDDELEAWRARPLGEIRYLMLDARYEKMRFGGVVRDAAVLSAIGIGPDERRQVLGVSVALSEAEVHWRAFLENLQARGMRGVVFVVSDDHAGLRAARRAVLAARHGSAVSSISPGTPSIMPPASRSANASAPNCARSGTPARWRKRRPPWPNWSQPMATLPRNSRHGWRRTSPKASPYSRCLNTIGGGCAPPTPWSARFSRSSSAAPSRSASSRTTPRSSASSAPYSSKSTTGRAPTRKPTSSGSARMRDHAAAESPDDRLLNTTFSSEPFSDPLGKS